MTKILIIKTSALGDIVHSFPVLNYLRQRFPDAQIDWVVEEQFADLLKTHPQLSNILCINTKKWRKALWKKENRLNVQLFRKELKKTTYDYVFDLQGNIKSGLITLQARSRNKIGFARQSVPEWPNILFTRYRFNPAAGQNIRQNYLDIVQGFFQDLSSNILSDNLLTIPEKQKELVQNIIKAEDTYTILVCPGSAWKNKQLTEPTLNKLLERLGKEHRCRFLFIWGSQEEKELVQRLSEGLNLKQIISTIVDRLPLSTLQHLMNSVNLVLAMDSLPLHLAGTTKTPTFSIFGASSAQKYKPSGEQHGTIQGTCPYGRTFEKRCPILRTCPTGSCIRDIDEELLYTAVNKHLAKIGSCQKTKY